jgi:hypothetical protein
VRCPDVFADGNSLSGVRYFLLSLSACTTDTCGSHPSSVQEFPVIMRQNITAGKTPVGTEVEAELVVGTMGDGAVFPKNEIF